MQKYARILVTSALPYANGRIHLGHLAGAYLPADIYVRYQRLRGRDVLFLSGSDEHGVSILISARARGITPGEVIDEYHAANREAFARAGICFDNYSRTSLPLHHDTARDWFLDFHTRGLLKQNVERQLYDEKAQMFLPDRFVTGTCPHCGNTSAYGDQCENCSTYYAQTELLDPVSLITGDTPVVRDAEHWHFPLGDWQQRVEEYVASHASDWKDNVLQQVRSWLKAGLSDRPITRDLEWGVPVPLDGAEGKVIYVWFEAVLGYISSAREWARLRGEPERWREYWCSPDDTKYVAFIGKDNIVFHCIMFPAMLFARGGYVVPDNVPANEFLNLEGRKFSKSRNWSIDVADFLDRYPSDPLRYTLTMNMPEARDTDFSWKDFQARTNNELADILGNFVNRTLHFTRRNFNGIVPPAGERSEADLRFLAEFRAASDGIADCIERYRFRDAAQTMMHFVRACNKYFNDEQPWKTLKSDTERCGSAIHHCLRAIHAIAVFCRPFLPDTSAAVRAMLRADDALPLTWDAAVDVDLPAGHALGEATILFRKIEDDEIAAEHARMGEPATATPPADAPGAAVR